MRDVLPQSRRVSTAVFAAGLAGLCAAGVGLNGATGVVPAEGGIHEQVRGAADDLAFANEKVNKVTAELNDAQKQLDAAQARLDGALARSSEAEADVGRAQQAVEFAEAQVARIESEIGKLEAELADLRAEIGQLARIAYTSGGALDELQIILDSQDPADFAARVAAVTRISRGNNQVLARLDVLAAKMDAKLSERQELEDRAQARRDEAAAKAAELQRVSESAAEAKTEVAQLVAAKQRIVAKANSERGAVQAQYDALKTEQRRIAAQIREALERERRREEAARRKREQQNKRPSSGSPGAPSNPAPSPPSRRPSGLAWPLPGYSVGGRTGPRIHPIYGYSSCHTGDDIGAPYGTAIRSVAAGYVISTNTGGPYGYHTVISHGGGLSSMYAHQSRFAVGSGQRVSRGQVIGYVGSTGYSTGPHLHFEIHVDGVPWEPMGWFGGSKYRVSCY